MITELDKDKINNLSPCSHKVVMGNMTCDYCFFITYIKGILGIDLESLTEPYKGLNDLYKYERN